MIVDGSVVVVHGGVRAVGSLLCAFTLAPVLCSVVLRGRIRERESRAFTTVRATYLRGLERVLQRHDTALAVAMGRRLAA